MNEIAEILPFKEQQNNKGEVGIEDIVCVINPVLACDLKQILLMTPESRRLEVAAAFCGLAISEVMDKSGLAANGNRATYHRWITHVNKLPLGAAFRIARLIGVPAEIIFADSAWRKGSEI